MTCASCWALTRILTQARPSPGPQHPRSEEQKKPGGRAAQTQLGSGLLRIHDSRPASKARSPTESAPSVACQPVLLGQGGWDGREDNGKAGQDEGRPSAWGLWGLAVTIWLNREALRMTRGLHHTQQQAGRLPGQQHPGRVEASVEPGQSTVSLLVTKAPDCQARAKPYCQSRFY